MAEKIGTIYYDLDLDDSKYKSKSKAAGSDADTFGSKLQGATVRNGGTWCGGWTCIESSGQLA